MERKELSKKEENGRKGRREDKMLIVGHGRVSTSILVIPSSNSSYCLLKL